MPQRAWLHQAIWRQRPSPPERIRASRVRIRPPSQQPWPEHRSGPEGWPHWSEKQPDRSRHKRWRGRCRRPRWVIATDWSSDPRALLETSKCLADRTRQLLRSHHARMFGRSDCLYGGTQLSGSLRVHAGREQGGANATEHVTRSRLGSPRRTRYGDEHGPSLGNGHQLGGTLQQHSGASLLCPGNDRSDRILFDPATITLEQPCQLARMGGQQPASRSRLWQIAKSIGI